MIGVKTKQYKLPQVTEAFTDVKVLLIALIGVATGVINGGIANFASALIRGYGFSGISATLLQLPTGAFEFILVPVCGLIAAYCANTRCIVLGVICLVPFGGLLGIRFTDLEHRWTLVGCTWLQYIVGAPVILSWNLLTTNVAGHTKRSFSNGLWFTLYAAGNIAGANIFFARERPRYFSALTGLCICYGGIIVIAALLWILMKRENLWRDAEQERRGSAAVVYAHSKEGVQTDQRAIDDGFNDLTDKQGRYFRYAL
ncbi:hypothetical protein LTS08_001185 [Lithohypha guttulata]|nr:hypothetical protein LTS08_001185 [Lithohypha guttulata]